MKTSLTLAALLTASILVAQEKKDRPTTVSLMGHAGDPLGEFDEAWGKQYGGLGGNFSVPFRRLPFEWGFQFDWSLMGSKSTVVAIDEEYLQATEGDLTTNCNMYGVHFMARFKPINGMISPYFDLLGGWRTFTARTKVKVDGVDGSYSNERNATDFAGSTGWAAGVMVSLSENMYVEGRYEKLEGSEVTYVDPDSIIIDADGVVSYETKTSNTDVYQIKLGIGFRF